MKEVKGKVCGKTVSKIAEERKAAFSRKMEKDIERFIYFIFSRIQVYTIMKIKKLLLFSANFCNVIKDTNVKNVF